MFWIAIIGWSISTCGWAYCYRRWKREWAARRAQQQRIDAAAEGLTRERRMVRP